MHTRNGSKGKQKGAVLALFAVAMVVIVAIAGLALDVSHAYINKTRLQNALDAAALSGAMTLNKLGDSVDAQLDATDDARTTFSNDLEEDLKGLVPIIEFSGTIDPFQPGVGTARYVRARVENHNTTALLLSVIGIDSLGVRASAVAGPVAINPCKVGPFVVCGDYNKGCTDPNDCYGYKVDEPGGADPTECYLKVGAEDQDDALPENMCGLPEYWKDGQIGPGNFGFKRYESCSKGGSGGGKPCMDESLGIGANDQCEEANNKYVDTQSGQPTILEAYNTIFGISGPGNSKKYPSDEFPPDTDTRTDIFYDEYTGNGRRVMPVVIARCDADPDDDCAASDYQFKENSGGTQCLSKLTVGCFFLTRPLCGPGECPQGKLTVYGQFIGECPSYGEKTLTPNPVFDINKIILYKDSASKDS